MSKRAMVLGGAGLIGSHLCIRLLKEGYDVICIDKRSRKESSLLCNIENRSRFHYIKHDVMQPYEIGCDELYNLIDLSCDQINNDYVDNHRLVAYSSMNSLNVAVGSNTKVLYASSDDVYNFNRHDVNYSSPQRFIAESKRFGESIHRAYSLQHGIDVSIARIFSTYGVGFELWDKRVVCKMIVAAINNNDIIIYGTGEQVRTFCWVDDVVEGLIRLMHLDNPSGMSVVDIGASTQITIRKLAELIVSLSGSRSNIHHIAARADEPRYKIPDLKNATNQLGWEPTVSLQEGLQRTICYIEKKMSDVAVDQMSWVEIYG